jgi:hypothetical protein
LFLGEQIPLIKAGAEVFQELSEVCQAAVFVGLLPFIGVTE